ncbi:zinc finger protein ZFP2-like [Cydia splendana]|uniref:zinc finger protein ZFP2-like n=1 Tax=Cydia splendana TaxID=1100963 RepID=UPI002120B58E
MEELNSCRCCLMRPPDKDLNSPYTRLGQTEIYADMLKECFEIHLPLGDNSECGICEICVSRLRDASDFKLQVQRCQVELQTRLTSPLKGEEALKVKMEMSDDDDDDNGAYILQLKEEMSDYEELKEEDGKLAELLAFEQVTVKRRKTSSSKTERKSRKILSRPALTLSLRQLSKMEKIKSPIEDRSGHVSESRKHRHNIENLLKYCNGTPFSNKTLYGYICAYCKETYPDPQDLRTHTESEHKNAEFYDTKRMDKNNMSVKLDITDLKCNLCNDRFEDVSTLKKHLIKQHDIKFHPDVKDYIMEFKLTSGDILNCAHCNSTFETFKMLLQHMNGHYRNYICNVCDMGFINKHRLKNHERTHDLGTYKCEFCDKVFSTRVRKMCHEKYTHNSNARYTTNCPHCDQSFTSYYQRNRHMFTEHNTVAASYKCNICDKNFILKSKLTSHIKKVHLMERNHICPECGQGFFIKQSLDEHMIKHNGERVHKCNVCLKAYARKKTLREHMRIHNNDRRFKCGVCGLAFVQKCSLKSHMLSNHGITLSEFESRELSSPQAT